MEKFFFKKTLVAVKFTKINEGSNPLTDPDQSLQLVTLKHPRGSYLKAHMHKPKKRITRTLQECLIVKKGKIRLDLYSPTKILFKNTYLIEGQALILLTGGYGIHLVEDSELFEIKNGPFIVDKILI